MKRRPFLPGLLALLLALTAAACGEGEDAGGVEESLSIEAFDFYFEPTSLQIEPGADVTIEFHNVGGVQHSFTLDDLDVEVEAGSGETAEVNFTAPDDSGTIDFYCKFHPDEMQGTLAVGGLDEEIEEDVDVEDDDDDADVEVDVEDDETEPATDDPDY